MIPFLVLGLLVAVPPNNCAVDVCGGAPGAYCTTTGIDGRPLNYTACTCNETSYGAWCNETRSYCSRAWCAWPQSGNVCGVTRAGVVSCSPGSLDQQSVESTRGIVLGKLAFGLYGAALGVCFLGLIWTWFKRE